MDKTIRMRSMLITAFLILSIVSSSCSTNETQDTEVTANAIQPSGQEAHHHEEVIRLNNGAKWKVDSHMMKYIRNMERHLKTAVTEHTETAWLRDSLETNIRLLTGNCTMEGEAHDELHKWLVPFLDLAEELKETTDTADTRTITRTLDSSFRTFNEYFE